MGSIEKIQSEIVKEFEMFDNWNTFLENEKHLRFDEDASRNFKEY